MNKGRIGNQIPTVRSTLPYTETRGDEAIAIYEESGRTAQEWQALMIRDILAYNDEGLWTHTKFGYSVPRRNGKNEVITMRELYGLTHGEKMLHTAHRVTTSASAAMRLSRLLASSGYEEVNRIKKDAVYDKHYVFQKQLGLERITLLCEGGGSCDFRTRTSKGGLGEGFDLLVIDEAQEYTDDQESSLKYVVSDSKNPQTVFCGTPPTAVSTGTVFKKMRDSVTSRQLGTAGWAEWSVSEKSDVNDVELWYKCNPSLGIILTERSVRDEIGSDELDFNIQRLGYWVNYDLKSAITKADWDKTMLVKKPRLEGGLFVGISYGGNGLNVSVSVSCKTQSGRVFTSVYDCKSRMIGDGWILEFIRNTPAIEKIIVDGRVGQQKLADQMKEAKLGKPIFPTGNDFIVACAAFERGVYDGNIAHMSQPALDSVVTNCEKKLYASGFTYRSNLESNDICIMNAAILSFWACSESKEKKRQRVQY